MRLIDKKNQLLHIGILNELCTIIIQDNLKVFILFKKNHIHIKNVNTEVGMGMK